MIPTICEKCGLELNNGDWPFCPHGRGTYTSVPDDIPGGLVMQHVCPGRKVYSRSELRRVLKAHGYELAEHTIEGGAVKDRHMSRWV